MDQTKGVHELKDPADLGASSPSAPEVTAVRGEWGPGEKSVTRQPAWRPLLPSGLLVPVLVLSTRMN